MGSMGKLRLVWTVVTDLFGDGYKLVSITAPFLSLAFTITKIFEVPIMGLREVPYAWAFLPLLIWVSIAYVRRWSKFNDLEQKRKPKIAFTVPRKRSSFKDTEMYIHLEIGIKNISSIENLSNCQVEMTELRLEGDIDFYKDFPLPISLRTMHQIGDRPKGRFNLDANREKFISVANISLKQHEDIIEIQHDGPYCPKISRNNYKMKLKAYPGGIEKLFLLKVKKQNEEEIIPLSENT